MDDLYKPTRLQGYKQYVNYTYNLVVEWQTFLQAKRNNPHLTSQQIAFALKQQQQQEQQEQQELNLC